MALIEADAAGGHKARPYEVLVDTGSSRNRPVVAVFSVNQFAGNGPAVTVFSVNQFAGTGLS